MKLLGKSYYCDRCGKQVFIKYTGSGPYRDGMNIHFSADGFEPPVGWTEHDGRDFCDECSEKYDSILKDFLAYKE